MRYLNQKIHWYVGVIVYSIYLHNYNKLSLYIIKKALKTIYKIKAIISNATLSTTNNTNLDPRAIINGYGPFETTITSSRYSPGPARSKAA